MAFLSSLDISGSGLTASRLRMDVISENIANADTTRTENGGPYRRKMVIYQAADNGSSFQDLLSDSMQSGSSFKGVKVTGIVEDNSDFQKKYDPTNPDADKDGYVLMPNVDITKETLDMMSVTRAYDANLSAFNAVKSMASKALEMGK